MQKIAKPGHTAVTSTSKTDLTSYLEYRFLLLFIPEHFFLDKFSPESLAELVHIIARIATDHGKALGPIVTLQDGRDLDVLEVDRLLQRRLPPSGKAIF